MEQTLTLHKLYDGEYWTPSELKQSVLAAVKPLFYQGEYSGQIITVEGEIANDPQAYGQVLFFNLKDANNCALNVRAPRNAFGVANLSNFKGLKVVVEGILDVQEKSNVADFDVMLKATKISSAGIGDRAKAELSLIRELEQKGYFGTKTPLPSFANLERCRVGVITSGSAAANAFEDIKKTLNNNPFFILTLYPVSLYAPDDIAAAITTADEQGFDILIVTRGGGERLDVFNDRSILDAVFNAKTPVISAVGHARDITLVDRVVDLSVGTPTEAAKVLSDNYNSVIERRRYDHLDMENRRLSKTLNDINNNFKSLQLNYNNKDQLLEQLAKELRQAKQFSHKILLFSIGLAVVALAIVMFLR